MIIRTDKQSDRQVISMPYGIYPSLDGMFFYNTTELATGKIGHRAGKKGYRKNRPPEKRPLEKPVTGKPCHRKNGHRKQPVTGKTATEKNRTGHRKNRSPEKTVTGKTGHRKNWPPKKPATGNDSHWKKTGHWKNWPPEKPATKKPATAHWFRLRSSCSESQKMNSWHLTFAFLRSF